MYFLRLFLISLSIFVSYGCAHHKKSDSEDRASNKTESTALAHQAAEEKSEAKAACFKGDTIKAWETRYVLAKSGADDIESEAFKREFARYKNTKNVPKEKCARIIWLKDKSCSDDFGSGRTRSECLSDPHYLKNIENDPYVGP